METIKCAHVPVAWAPLASVLALALVPILVAVASESRVVHRARTSYALLCYAPLVYALHVLMIPHHWYRGVLHVSMPRYPFAYEAGGTVSSTNSCEPPMTVRCGMMSICLMRGFCGAATSPLFSLSVCGVVCLGSGCEGQSTLCHTLYHTPPYAVSHPFSTLNEWVHVCLVPLGISFAVATGTPPLEGGAGSWGWGTWGRD